MVLQNIIDGLSESERVIYEAQTASEYFRYIFYSKESLTISKKLETSEKLNNFEWDYLMKRLFLVTVKAIEEENSTSIVDKINYVINKVAVKVLKKGKVYSECVKMLSFIESLRLENEINDDLSNGFERVKKSKNEQELDILLRQHREAALFRDNQDAFLDSYKNGKVGIMSDDELLYIDCMDRAFIREKELVKEYK